MPEPTIHSAEPTGAGVMPEMLASHVRALRVVADAKDAIASGAVIMAGGIQRGARLHYAAAGSSGLMALADASELPGTFGIPQSQIAVHMAGGVPVGGVMPGDTEDDADAGMRAAEVVAAQDVAIVVSASGTTPYALAFAEAARARSAEVICIANVAEAALLDLAHVAIALNCALDVAIGTNVCFNVSTNCLGNRLFGCRCINFFCAT